MKKILIIVAIIIAFVAGLFIPRKGETKSIPLERKVVGEWVQTFDTCCHFYKEYKAYKRVWRRYNYVFYQDTLHDIKIDSCYSILFTLNEFGDTIDLIYLDI